MIVMIAVAGSVKAQTPPQRYQIRSGQVEYKIFGNESGSAVVYFKDWGLEEARFAVCRMPVYGLQNMLTLSRKDWVMTMDLDKRVGRKFQNAMMTEYLDPTRKREKVPFDEMMMNKLQGERIGTEEILGRPCEIWEIKDAGVRLWYWKWIPLKTVLSVDGYQVVMIAEKLSEDDDIPSAYFQIPEGIRFMNQDINQILISLLRP